MIFGQDRQELRQMYVDAWQKSLAGQVMSPLEVQIAAIVAEHPEYRASLEPGALDSDFTPGQGQSNPFLHMGLHLAIREQVATDRPTGVAAIHRNLSRKTGDPHRAEHRMIDCLAESLWEAQSRNRPPDERQYIEHLQQLEI